MNSYFNLFLSFFFPITLQAWIWQRGMSFFFLLTGGVTCCIYLGAAHIYSCKVGKHLVPHHSNLPIAPGAELDWNLNEMEGEIEKPAITSIFTLW